MAGYTVGVCELLSVDSLNKAHREEEKEIMAEVEASVRQVRVLRESSGWSLVQIEGL
jgi:hypothetical protein